MFRSTLLVLIALSFLSVPVLAANPLRGKYAEARTCQVYTGPCFANGEVGLAGKDAVLTWMIDSGSFADVDVSGLGVALVVKASHTIGFQGFEGVETAKAIMIVDARADAYQTAALKSFALTQTHFLAEQIADSYRADFDMQFDMGQLTAKVKVGEFAQLQLRKARPGDCICSNESAYYPPLVELKGFVPGVTIEGNVTARRLGTRWSIPDTRTAYLGTFEFDAAGQQLAQKL